MSELNKKKNNFFKVIVIYLILAVWITGSLIFLNKKYNFNIENYISNLLNNEEKVIEENRSIEGKNTIQNKFTSKNVRKIKLSDKYYLNNIKITDVQKEEGKYLYTESWSQKDKNIISIDYPQISGLKDKDVEENINNKIYERIKEIQEKHQEEKMVKMNVNAFVYGNFADVISIGITCQVYNNDTTTSKDLLSFEYDYFEYDEVNFFNYGINLSLKDGKEFKFNDLFTNDASIKTILTNVTYEDLAMEYIYQSRAGDEYFDGDMDTILYPELEENVFKILSKYNQNNDVEFCFSPSNIDVYIDNNNPISISMKEIVDYIAIYTRFLSNDKSIYENGNLEKKDYVCNYPFSAETYKFEEITDNLFISARLSFDEDVEGNKEETEKFADKLIKKIKVKAEKNKAYICTLNVNSYNFEKSSDARILIMDKTYYKENKDIILFVLARGMEDSIDQFDQTLIEEERVKSAFIWFNEGENGEILMQNSSGELVEVDLTQLEENELVVLE